MEPPKHHKEIARHLHEKIAGNVKVVVYADDDGRRKIAVGEYGSTGKKFYSTIGAFDSRQNIPPGNFEFAAYGLLDWLPRALVSSIYWLKERTFTEWPLVCEDVVRHNVKSIYRHMAYIPSGYTYTISTGKAIKWLLGVPITDNEIGFSFEEIRKKLGSLYPGWWFNGR